LVVQSRGMARWVTLSLAEPLGIAASFAFELPKSFCFRMTDLILETPDESPSLNTIFADRQRLTWSLFGTLPGLLDKPELKPVSRYLRDDPNQLKRFQLSSRMADCFDNYQLYRPEMLSQWMKPGFQPSYEEEKWQRLWWLAITGQTDDRPLHELVNSAIDALMAQGDWHRLPKRLSIFGISSLPPLFLQLIHRLSARIEVSIYVVNPTEQFWGDLPTGNKAIPSPDPGMPEVDMAFGHDLLISLGRQGRDFFNLLQQMDDDGQAWKPLDFPLPPRDSLLHHLQADIANLVRRGPREADAPTVIEKADRSLQCHVCHGPLREMEVLRDLILAAFEELPDLRPHDVLVMVPDITKYAPFIEATFGQSDHQTTYLPFSIADQSLSDTLPLTRAVLALIEVMTGRMAAHSVFDLLEIPAIRRRFGISEPDLEELRHWIDTTKIAWARDGKHRRKGFALPEFEENSWRLGLDRLMLTYAMGDYSGMVCGMAPIGQSTTSQAELLGHFAEFLECLFQFQTPLGKPHTLPNWSEIFNDLLQTFFETEFDEEEVALQSIRDRIATFPEVAETCRIEDELSLNLVLEPLRQLLRQEGFGSGFINGKITFCAMKPMRTIPYKVVCMAGLNDGDFPRQDQPSSFDLMAKSRKPGDRSMREDDRYLFLEAILASEARFVLTYIGHHPEDLQPVPPASVLQELLDHLDRAFQTIDGDPISRQILIHHPAQPFDRRYFDRRFPELFTYNQTRFATALVQSGQTPTPFLTGPLPAAAPEKTLKMTTLADFWKNPARFFCREILGIHFSDRNRQLRDSEPLEVDGLLKYQLDRRIFECKVGESESHLANRLKAEGLLPPGHLGEAHYSHRERKTEHLVTLTKAQTYLPEQRFTVELNDYLLEARFWDLTPAGRFVARPAAIKSQHWLDIWLHHLFIQLVDESELPCDRVTEVAGLKSGQLQHFRLGPVPNADTLLGEVIQGFISGQTSPLPLFGETSFSYAESAFKAEGKEKSKAKIKYADHWMPSNFEFEPGNQNPYYRLCFGHGKNFDFQPPSAHRNVAKAIWFPLFETREEVT